MFRCSGNSIVYSLIQHLSKIFGDTASIDNSSLQSSFQASTAAAAAAMPPLYLYDRHRKQWISNRILDWLLQNSARFKPNLLYITC
jgi:hypothetical protein